MFFRIATDGVRTPVDLRGHFAGPQHSVCWIIGGGPSLAAAPCEAIQRSPAAKLAVNLCGHGLIRPTIWTAYDPTARFHRSTYLDGSILKLLPARRGTDVVPDSTFKVCECPNLLFFEREPRRGFHDFPPAGATCDAAADATGAVVDWQDSLVQALELAWWLGFRKLLLAGCDMHVRPDEAHRELARKRGVEYRPRELLKSFYDRCQEAGLPRDELEIAAAVRPYHFDETKPLAAAIQTDWHYFRVVQYLRLSRRAMGLAGMELVSATPGSRLNDFFPYRPAEELVAEVLREVGDPARERTRGRYSKVPPQADGGGLMRDFRPHNWPAPARRASGGPPVDATIPRAGDAEAHPKLRQERARAAAAELPDVAIDLDEVG